MSELFELRERVARLLALPGLIDAVGKRLVAQRAERRKVERRIAFRQAEIRLDLDVSAYPNEKMREAAYLVACGKDADLANLQDRLEQLLVAIDRYTHEKEVLDHERKALKAALEREYAVVLERVLTDQMLASRLTTGARA